MYLCKRAFYNIDGNKSDVMKKQLCHHVLEILTVISFEHINQVSDC